MLSRKEVEKKLPYNPVQTEEKSIESTVKNENLLDASQDKLEARSYSGANDITIKSQHQRHTSPIIWLETSISLDTK